MGRATIKMFIDQCDGLEALAEIERLRPMADEVQAARHVMREHNRLLSELAASQARERQLREALGVAGRNMETAHEYDREREDLSCAVFSGGECDCHVGVVNEALRALALPQDTSALEALISRAGEVMRERCSLSVLLEHGGPEDECRPALEECSEAIRALPGVKLEDLQK